MESRTDWVMGGNGLRLADMMAVVRRGGLDGGGGNQRRAEDDEMSFASFLSPVTTARLWDVFCVFAVAADMAMRPADTSAATITLGRANFLVPAKYSAIVPVAPMDLTCRNPVQWAKLVFRRQ